MKKIVASAVALTAIMGSFSAVSASSDGVNILNDIKLKGEIRPRYEHADVKDSGKDAANAFTARTHLAITAGLLEIDGLSTTIGIQTVNNFGYTDYNDGFYKDSSGKKQPNNPLYDTIVDPQAAMLSESTLDYKIGKTALHAGRSHVNLDNQRFIGTVGWRQNERSYDTVYVANNDIENLNVLAAFVYGYAGVANVTTTNTKSVLLHANYKVMDELSITGYGYLLSSIHDTYGVALTGNVDMGAKLNYRAEYAMQTDPTLEYSSLGKPAVDASYINLDLGANISGILVGGNYELQSGADTGGKTQFTTPLGTNHKFNGWADVFLNTPTGGLADANVRVGYKAKGFGKLLGVYHMFSADTDMATSTGTGTDLGTEFDVVYVNAIPGVKNLKGLAKFAAYQKGEVTGYTSDKQVAWLQLDYKF